jgi:guanidinopropionase
MNDLSNPQNFPQPVSGTVVPRFGDVATFMRMPLFRNPADVEIGMIGVPWDGGTTNRPGARHGPRQMRDLSTMMRRIHHVTRIAPYELAKCGDLGDAPVNPASLDDSLERIEHFYAKIHAAGAIPLSAGGDHLITLPIMRGIAKGQAPLGMVHFDAHSDTWDKYFAGKKYSAGTPFRRAVEEEIVSPAHSIQVGLRGSLFSPTDVSQSIDLGYDVVTTDDIFAIGIEALAARISRRAAGRPAFITFDMDFVDPSAAPGVQTPEAGGPTARETLALLRALSDIDLVGCDVVEVNPLFDGPSQITALLAATVMAELMALKASAAPG